MSEQYWLKATMKKNYTKGCKAFNAGYTKGREVYVSNTPHDSDGEGHMVYRIFNGSNHYGFIDMSIEEAREYVQMTRINGKTVKASNQKEIKDEYFWMMNR